MKGAIGNALIMNIVITFIIIFFSLLIGSMAYSKAYKTKNYLLNLIDKYDGQINGYDWFIFKGSDQSEKWEQETGEYLKRIGYPINQKANTCPNKEEYNYIIGRDNENQYDYCIYVRFDIEDSDNNVTIKERYNYMVLVYMKLDLPVIGNYIRLPITGETKAYTILR